MDETCGGAWWRDANLGCPIKHRRGERVVAGYRQFLERETSCKTWCVPVRNRDHQEPRYYLTLLSRHPDGLWEFGEAVSNALKDWRKFVDEAEFGLGETLFDWESHLNEMWTTAIARNLLTLIASGAAPFAVRDRYEDVMGETLGQARSIHIRAAVKQLHATGQTATVSKGKVDAMLIRPPARE